MYSKVDIFKMALGFMGAGSQVTEPSENTVEGIQLNLYWDLARRTVLSDFPYSFSIKRKSLSEVNKPEEYINFEYAYALPIKCLKVLSVIDSLGNTKNLSSEDDPLSYFRLVNLDNSKILLSNSNPCTIEYIEDIDNLNSADDSFVEMLAYKLAALVCTPLLRGDGAKLQELNQLYGMKLAQAMQNNASAERLPKKQDSWVAIVKNN